MPIEAGKIRNVAVVGHRGTGKTSLVEALLFQAGKTNRLGTIEAGSTVSDWEEDEQRRQMSLSAALVNLEWEGRKINMLDRERADFYRVLGAVQEQLSDRCIAVQLPIGSEHELTGVVDLLHNCAYLD